MFQELNLTKRTFVTRAIWAIAEQGINPIVQFAITPLLVRQLGVAQFGIWALAITILSLSQIASIGVPLAATRFVAAHLDKNAASDAVGTIRAGLTIVLLGGTVAAVLGYATASAVYTAAFRSMGPENDVAPVIALTGVSLLVQELDNLYASALRGAERYDLCAWSEITCRIFMGAILVLVAPSVSLTILFAILVLLSAIKAVIKGVQVALKFKSFYVLVPSAARRTLAQLFQFGKWQWLQVLGTLLFTGSDQLIVGSALGPTQLARYSICLQLAQYVHLLPSVGMQVLIPRISARVIGMRLAGNNAILRTATKLSLCVGASVGVPLLIFAYPLLYIWMGPEFANSNVWLLRVLVLVHLGLTFNIGAYYTMLSLGRVADSARIVLLAGLSQLIASLFFVRFGMTSVVSCRMVYAFATGFLFLSARSKEDFQ